MDGEFKFKVGERVLVRTGNPPGHIRTPRYIRGKAGVVTLQHGHFRNPEQLAFGKDGLPKIPLYAVRFPLADVTANAKPSDTIVIDIFEHWLEPAP